MIPPIEHLEIDDWFENVTLIFRGTEDTDNVICTFKNCYEVSLNHDENSREGPYETKDKIFDIVICYYSADRM